MQLPKTKHYFLIFMQGLVCPRSWGALRALCKSDPHLYLLPLGTRSQAHIQVNLMVGADLKVGGERFLHCTQYTKDLSNSTLKKKEKKEKIKKKPRILPK